MCTSVVPSSGERGKEREAEEKEEEVEGEEVEGGEKKKQNSESHEPAVLF